MGQLEDMTAFVRVVEAGSISRAAAQMGVVKSAVSRRLMELEQRMGVQLIARTTRKSSLTEAGRSYYQSALQILSDVSELNATISNTSAELEGEVKIAVPVTFGLQHLTSVINEFAVQNPRLAIHIDFSDRQIDLVEEGFDLAVRIAQLQDSTHIARKLVPIRIVLCATPAYLASHGTPNNPRDLKAHSVLQYFPMDSTSWKFIAPDRKSVTANIKTKLSANNGEFLHSAAVNGQGIARLPTFVIWKELQSGELVRVMPDFEIEPLYAYAIYPQTRHLNRRTRALIDFLATKFGARPYWDKSIS